MTQATLERVEARDGNSPFKKTRSKFFSVFEFCLFLTVGMLLLEPIMKWGGVVDEENYIVDRKVGWTPVPNRQATYRVEGFSRYTINSLGMRDFERTIAKPANTFRIAVVGCSMTEGKQVPIEQTYCSLLEKKLNEGGGSIKYEVLNFAVSAYTLGQEYLRMKHFAMQFKPDLVLFTIRPNALLYMGPDLRKGFFNARPVFGVMPDGRLVEDHNFQNHWLASAEGKRTQGNTWLATNSHLYALVGKCAFNIAGFKKECIALIKHPFDLRSKKPVADGDGESGVDVRLSPTLSGALDYLGKVAEAVVREAKSVCDKANCQFILVYLPSSSKYRAGEEEKIVSDFSRRLKIPLIDCNPELDRIERISAKSLYVEVHPSRYGHEKIAEYLENQLAARGFYKSSD